MLFMIYLKFYICEYTSVHERHIFRSISLILVYEVSSICTNLKNWIIC